MSHLLYVKASPRGAASRSIAIADAYLDALTEANPSITVDELDLWTAGLPEFDGDRAAAKMNMVSGLGNTGRHAAVWDEIVNLSHRFAAARRYLFAVPMWNGSIPYKLKQLIDIVHQPGLTYGLNRQDGYYGLLADRKATLVLTSGAFAPGAVDGRFGVDHHSSYLRAWLAQAGIIEVNEVRLHRTLIGTDTDAQFERAIAEARALGASAV